MKTLKVDQLTVNILDTRDSLGEKASEDISSYIRLILTKKESVNIIFAAAPSQNEMLDSLSSQKNIDWSRVNAFHMDEYIGLPEKSNNSFGNYLDEHIFKKVSFGKVFYINSIIGNSEEKCKQYSNLLSDYPPDIVLLGIGENGHIAFNEPYECNFKDKQMVKVVDLDDISRKQQVHDKCFTKLNDVPKQAITLTIPILCQAKRLFCCVPSLSKTKAIKEMLTTKNIDEHCPASILRRLDYATLYCDKESASEVI